CVPRYGNRLPGAVWPRLIRARGDSLLTELAHVPILLVGHVPERDRVLRFEIVAGKGVRMEKPITHDQCSFGRLRPKLMHHHIFRMHRQEHVREDRIIKNALRAFFIFLVLACRAVAERRRVIMLNLFLPPSIRSMSMSMSMSTRT